MSLPVVAAAPSSETAARLEVDTSELGGVGPVLKERLLERGAQVFRDEDIGPGSSEDPIVRVSVRELEGEDPGFGYEVRLITRAGEDGTAWSERCELCTESELIEAVAVELDKVAGSIRALEETAAEASPRLETPPPVVTPNTSDGVQPTIETRVGSIQRARSGLACSCWGLQPQAWEPGWCWHHRVRSPTTRCASGSPSRRATLLSRWAGAS